MAIQRKTILITGASSGLGRGLALALSHGDNNLVITARRAELLDEVAAAVRAQGSRCVAVPADGTDPVAAQSVVDAAVREFGGIDVAILNAGGGAAMSMADTPADAVLRVMRTNYDTLVNLLCPIIALMTERPGTIAWTGSPAGFFGLPKSGPYSAAKAAGRLLFDTCRIELAGSGIRFVALYPGFTETPGLDPDDVPLRALIIQPDRAVREMLRAIERGRAHAMFPRRIAWLMALARLLPEFIRRRILAVAARLG